ncbi:competence type IV pilus minor pilin ComGE [Neobacillus niacini]|uniref:competence type IV pilus minor pilin ComGE n=1 Tax=Neobacillus niacini TaxID=86668 RepID=UPI00285B1A13|nr:competence protein ComGC [Neobacillus niacini]
MLQKNKGFFLLELLLSLSAWFMMCLFFMPIIINLNSQSKKLEIEKKSRQLVFQELEAQIIEGKLDNNYSVFQDGIEYKISWRDSVFSGAREVCVNVEETSFLSKTEICGMQE